MIGGLNAKVKSARLLKTGAAVKFEQSDTRVRFTGMPDDAPDNPMTVIEVECDSEPSIDHNAIRPEWKRYKVGTRDS